MKAFRFSQLRACLLFVFRRHPVIPRNGTPEEGGKKDGKRQIQIYGSCNWQTIRGVPSQQGRIVWEREPLEMAHLKIRTCYRIHHVIYAEYRGCRIKIVNSNVLEGVTKGLHPEVPTRSLQELLTSRWRPLTSDLEKAMTLEARRRKSTNLASTCSFSTLAHLQLREDGQASSSFPAHRLGIDDRETLDCDPSL